ncbi:hypothetical protein [Streptomyces sp. NPDC005077]
MPAAFSSTGVGGKKIPPVGGVQIWHASVPGPAARTVQLRIVTNVRQAGR